MDMVNEGLERHGFEMHADKTHHARLEKAGFHAKELQYLVWPCGNTSESSSNTDREIGQLTAKNAQAFLDMSLARSNVFFPHLSEDEVHRMRDEAITELKERSGEMEFFVTQVVQTAQKPQ